MKDVQILEKTLCDWVLARDDGLWLVGRPDRDMVLGRPTTLSPVFEFTVQVLPQRDDRGRVVGQQVMYGAQPIAIIGSIDHWNLSADANLWPVKGCSVESQIRSGIENAVKLQLHMRASQAGIQLAGAMPQLPAPVGK